MPMTDGESCPGGGAQCNYSEMHELALVEKVMREIEQYNKDRDTDPCPVCLRDAMLAVAALLHMEAGRLALRPRLLAGRKPWRRSSAKLPARSFAPSPRPPLPSPSA